MKRILTQATTKLIAALIAVILIASVLPVVSFANEVDADGYVYLSISFDGKYIYDQNDSPIVYRPIALADIAAVDLTAYGLDNMLFDGDGDGEYDTTALQLLIYAHEVIYGGDWSDVSFDALPGSSYFAGGIFGFTENLVYFLNGDFPVDESQSSDWMTTGATSDRIVLQAGDFLDVASFGCYSFLWDQLGGFHLFADEEGGYVHDYTAEAGTALPVKLKHSFCDLMFGQSWVRDAEDYEIFYGSVFGVAEGTVTTDENGNAEITFGAAGTYYLWCNGAIGSDDGTHGSCDRYFETYEPCIVSSPAYAKVTVTGGAAAEPDAPRQPQSVREVLNATMAQLAVTVNAPSFGTSAGEWTVFSLARGGYFAADSAYFADYYDRIVETVNQTAASVGLNGALDKSKSTENSRLIVALSAIGKDATAVGDWDLVEAYSANGINWIKKQGMNGTIWALIALDSNHYETSDPTIREQCVAAILDAQHDDGGWSLVTDKAKASNVDVTCMTLTALYPYRSDAAVEAACEEAIAWLSEVQLENGGFPYGSGETSESCAWAIVALTMWGIDPDTDPRFVKNGSSAVDNLLTYYIPEKAMFEHGKGAGANAMATDQCCYALVAYDRFFKGEAALYDYSDVTFEVVVPDVPVTPDVPASEEIGAIIGLPEKVECLPGTVFHGVISVNGWSNQGAYKLIDLVVDVPAGLSVVNVAAGGRLGGGALSYHLNDGKLRIVYFDANTNSDLTVSGETFPIELFDVTFRVEEADAADVLTVSVSDMSIKRSSDPTSQEAAVKINVEKAVGSVTVVEGVTYSAKELYSGDGVDLIPADKKAVLVTVTMQDGIKKLTYNDGTNTVAFRYNAEISAKLGVPAYVALVDAAMNIEKFEAAENFTVEEADAESISFGDVNGDGVINAQDALAVVDLWLRRGDAPNDGVILRANVNGDGRIDTYDALSIVEAFVYDDRIFAILSKSTVVVD